MRPVFSGCAMLAAVLLSDGGGSVRSHHAADERGSPPSAARVLAASGLAALGPVWLDSTAAPSSPPTQAPVRGSLQQPAGPHEFYFTRGIYTSHRRWGGRSWAIDWPKADEQFISVLDRLVDIDVYPIDNPVSLADPELRRYPFLYVVEVGYMTMTEAEVEGLRSYLLAGGFLVVDDFWGTVEWANFEREMRRVFPERDIVELSLDHPIFNAVYRIDEILQVPAIGNWQRWRRTVEQDGWEPHVRGIFDDRGRLMVLINWNTDLGDAWEWAEQPDYPLTFSTYAFRMGVNFVVYAMSH